MSYLHFVKTTRNDVVGAVDFVAPGNILFLPIEETLHDEKCFFRCSFRTALFLNPVNCLTTINNLIKNTLSNFWYSFHKRGANDIRG